MHSVVSILWLKDVVLVENSAGMSILSGMSINFRHEYYPHDEKSYSGGSKTDTSLTLGRRLFLAVKVRLIKLLQGFSNP